MLRFPCLTITMQMVITNVSHFFSWNTCPYNIDIIYLATVSSHKVKIYGRHENLIFKIRIKCIYVYIYIT